MVGRASLPAYKIPELKDNLYPGACAATPLYLKFREDMQDLRVPFEIKTTCVGIIYNTKIE